LIYFKKSLNNYLNEVLISSYTRVLTSTQITDNIDNASIIVVIDSSKISSEEFLNLQNSFKKVIFHGSPSIAIQDALDLQTTEIDLNKLHQFDGDFPNSISNTKGYIKYIDHELTKDLKDFNRYLARYDFTDEWNNLGYGQIPRDESIWSISSPFIAKENNLAVVKFEKTDVISFVTLKDISNCSIMWINRQVGLPDGFDWVIIEEFISSYRHKDLITLPILMDIPFGYESAVTMRLDCDENVYSCTPLLSLYSEIGFPLSIAIKTEQKLDKKSKELCDGIVQNGGSIHSHSHTHAPDWGQLNNGAKWEMEISSKILNDMIGSNFMRESVVSPFHQNSVESVKALEEFGVKSFVGGIIKNDPEYLMARSGIAPFTKNISTHSQQCMLHGDCYHNAGNSLETYKESFRLHRKTRTMFGFLDHPFSDYNYGWSTENERLDAHKEFLNFIKSHDKTAIMNLHNAMSFVQNKSCIRLSKIDEKIKYEFRENNISSDYNYAIKMNNEVIEIL